MPGNDNNRKPSQQVCIVGVFRAGTNVAKAVVDSTFGISASFNSVFWKHQVMPTLPYRAMAETSFIILIKNPFHQLVSWYEYSRRKPHMAGAETFDEFIRSPIWISEDRASRPDYFFPDPVVYWNQYYFTCADLAAKQPDKYVMVRYEDLVLDTRTCVAILGDKLNLTPDFSKAVVPGHWMRNLKGDKKFDARIHAQDIPYDTSIVRHRTYMSAYTESQESWVRAGLLPKLASFYPA